jgi:predicted amidophosphoribosyltransferase
MPPSRNDIRNDIPAPGTATCPTCQQPFTPIRRQTYCTPACRQAPPGEPATHNPGPHPPPSRPGTSRRDITVYQCPHCDTRYLGQQWCHNCHTPCTRLDHGGLCPHCSEPVAISDIIEQFR